MNGVRLFLLCGFLLGAVPLNAAPAGAAAEVELVFKTPAGKKAFDDAKTAFGAKKYSDVKSLLSKANRDAKDKATKAEIKRWAAGLRGLQDLLLLEKKLPSRAGFVYENAQRKYLVNIANPSGELFRKLLDDLEKPERRLVELMEGFDRHGPYSAKFGKTFINKSTAPQFVIAGQRSLKWECKDRGCIALKISNVPTNWSEFAYIGMWVYGVKGRTSDMQVFAMNARKKGAGRAARGRFDGYQGKINPVTGWQFITLPLPTGDKKAKGSLRRVGSGNLTSMASLQLQLPTVKRFTIYLDHIVLVRKK